MASSRDEMASSRDEMATAGEDGDVSMEAEADRCEFMQILKGSGQPLKEGLPKIADKANFLGNLEVGGGSRKRDLFTEITALCIPVHQQKQNQPLSATSLIVNCPRCPRKKKPQSP